MSRTFVSAASGNDANNCDRPTPCRTFQGAHDKTNADGEITVLDPGGYGAVVITKSISIVNDGVGEAGMLVSGGATGITINGGPATYVNLRGITVQGIGFGGSTGLKIHDGFSLTITNCVFRNHTGNGINFLPGVAGTHHLSISDTLLADNGVYGVGIGPSGANAIVRATVDRVRMVNNGFGGLSVEATSASTVNAVVTDSVAAGNGRQVNGPGFQVLSNGSGGATASLTLIRSVSANNSGSGVFAGNTPAASLRVGQSALASNGAGWFAVGGATVQSFGDNYIIGNADGDVIPPQTIRK